MKSFFLKIASLVSFIIMGITPSEALTTHHRHYKFFDWDNPKINISKVLSGGPAPEGIPAIDNPKYISVSNAINLKDDDQVVGITIGGKTRAYPIRILNWHEIVNDNLGGEKISIIWCPLCGSSIVMDREINGRELTFGVSGYLYQSDVLMYDRQTKSLWSQLEMRGVTGTYSDVDMKLFPSFVTSWGEFKREFKNADVLSFDTGHKRFYAKDPYKQYTKSDQLYFPVTGVSNKHPAKSPVYGVRIKDGDNYYTAAFPVHEASNWQVGDYKFTIGNGIGMTLHVMEPKGRFEVSFTKKDLEIQTAYAYWFAWSAFNPKTTLITQP